MATSATTETRDLRPFVYPCVDKLREVRPDVVVVDGLFAKADDYAAGADGQKFDDVHAAITLTGELLQAVTGAGHV